MLIQNLQRAATREIVTILTMTPYTGVNHSLLGVSDALRPTSSLEIRPSVPKKLVDEFKAGLKQTWWTDGDFSPLILEAARRLTDRFDFITELNASAQPVIILNHGSSPKRILQALALKIAIGRAFLVGINYPGIAEEQFDLTIAAPSKSWRPDYPARVLPVGSVPNQITAALLHRAREDWEPVLRYGQRKLIAVLIGGDVGGKNKKNYRPFTVDHAREVIDLALATSLDADADLVISTSRRTPEPAIGVIQTALASWPADQRGRPPMLHVPFRNDARNPYLGMLACADAIIVTADSLSMMSEAVDTGRPVFAVKPADLLRREHVLLYNHLLRHDHITELPARLHFNPGKPILSANAAAQEILRMTEVEWSRRGLQLA